MFDINIKKVFAVVAAFFVFATIGGAVSQKIYAQVDVEACQSEYNASRSQCIADNNSCVGGCGGNQTCELDCNTVRRNACDDAAVAQQKKCLDLDDSSEDLPAADVQPASQPQTTFANQIDCQSAAEAAGQACEGAAFACYDSCKSIKDASFYECQNACHKKSRDCYQARNDAYDTCVSGRILPVIPQKQKPSEQPLAPLIKVESSLDLERMNASAKVQALISQRPKPPENISQEEIIQPESDIKYMLGVPYGPFVSDEQSNTHFKYKLTTKSGGEPPRIILPDGKELDLYDSVDLATYLPAGTKIITQPDSYFVFQFTVESFYERDAYVGGVLTNKAGDLRHEFGKGVLVEIAGNSELDVQEIYNGLARMQVNRGFVRFTYLGTRTLGVASPTGVAPITKGTDFGMSYDPKSKTTIVEIYDGSVDIFDLTKSKVLTSITTVYGGDIKQVTVTSDGVVEEKIAIPQSEWPAFVAKQQKSRFGAWMWVLVTLIIGGMCYMGYRNKDAVLGVFKKQSM